MEREGSLHLYLELAHLAGMLDSGVVIRGKDDFQVTSLSNGGEQWCQHPRWGRAGWVRGTQIIPSPGRERRAAILSSCPLGPRDPYTSSSTLGWAVPCFLLALPWFCLICDL